MGVWPQRPRFIELVKAKVKAGASMAEIAHALGMAESTLRGYMEQWSRPPKKKALELAAVYFSVDLAELLGPEIPEADMELRHARAMMRDSLGADKAASTPDEDALKFYRLAKSVIAASFGH